MTNQPGVSGSAGMPIVGAAAAAGAFDNRDDGHETDNGVPVGEADVQVDRERASGEADDPNENELDDVLDDGGSTTDDGVPVGTAEAEEDRRRASREASDRD